jgi:hypothetical protein
LHGHARRDEGELSLRHYRAGDKGEQKKAELDEETNGRCKIIIKNDRIASVYDKGSALGKKKK